MSGSASEQGKASGKGGVNYTGLPYPPFTTLTTPDELNEWAMRVESCFKAIDNRIVENFNKAINPKEVGDACSMMNAKIDGIHMQMATEKFLEQAQVDISKFASGLVEDVKNEFGKQGYSTNVVKAELDNTRAELETTIFGAQSEFNELEANVVGTIDGTKEKFSEIDQKFQALYDATKASEQHLRGQIGQEFAARDVQKVDPISSPSTDPWKLYVSAASPPTIAGSLGSAGFPPGMPLPAGLDSKGQGKGLHINNRDWGSDTKKLNNSTHPEQFPIWKTRAEDFLCSKRGDVRPLLEWAATETSTILPSTLQAKATQMGILDIVEVNYQIYVGTKSIIHDDYIQKALSCNSQGFEFGGSSTLKRWGRVILFLDLSGRNSQTHPSVKIICTLGMPYHFGKHLGPNLKQRIP